MSRDHCGAGRGTGFGTGFDSGEGYGLGRSGGGYHAGYGEGNFNGSGYGFGYGYGFGGTSGRGNGDGYEAGYGNSSVRGNGEGFWPEHGVLVGQLGEFEVRRTPWGISVGCQLHTLDVWREKWREVAEEYEAGVTEEEVADWLQKLALIGDRRPLAPHQLVGALQDRVHKDVGEGRAVKTRGRGES